MRHPLIALPLFALTTALATPLAMAQSRVPLDLPYLKQVETRYGLLTVDPEGSSEARGFLLDGAPIDGPKDIHAHIQAVLPMPQGGAADWVLVSLSGGGNDCPMLFAFLVVSKTGATATEPFGTCSEAVMNLRETEGNKVALDMIGNTDGVIAVHIYRFDGATLDETVNPLP